MDIGTPGVGCKDCVAIIVPVFNDWEPLAKLLGDMDDVLGSVGLLGRVTVVDDGSTEGIPANFKQRRYSHLSDVEVVRLVSNLGHQRAISVGMAHLNQSAVQAKAVVIIDGDGQDRPQDIPALVDELSHQRCSVVFAQRTERSEEFLFRFMYGVYHRIHRLLTGVRVCGGNFSALSVSALPGLLVSPDLWNHYAGSIARSRVRIATLPLKRGVRYSGKSHMPYSSLVAHGLSSLAIFSDIIGGRLIILFAGLLAILLVFFVAESSVQAITPLAFVRGVTAATGVMILFTLQGLLSALFFALIVLGRRSEAKVVPLRDALGFIQSIDRVFP